MQFALEKLDVSDPANVENWHERFEFYVAANRAINTTNKVAWYLSHVGKDAYNLLKDLSYPEPLETKTVDEFKRLLLGHLRPASFETTERAKFHMLVRRKGESFRAFLLQLRKQAAKCNFGSDLLTQMRDRIVAGVNDTDLQKRLLRQPGLTYDKARIILESADDVDLATASNAEVLAVRKPETPTRQGGQRNFRNRSHSKHRARAPENAKMLGQCNSCGGRHERRTCKFRDAECHQCHRKGHIRKVCRSGESSTSKVAAIDFDSGDSDYTTLAVGNGQHLYHTVYVGGRSTDFIIDTGSPVSFLARDALSEWLSTGFELKRTKATISGVTGHNLTVLGQVQVNANNANSTSTVPLDLLITDRGPSILGLDGLRALEVKVVLSTSTPSCEIGRLLKACGTNSGGMDVPPVKLQVDAEPKFCKARPVPFGLRAAVEKNLQELVSEGILSPARSSSWATPIVTPLKSNGVPRICGDYRVTVNPVLKQTASTTREVEEMFAGLKGQAFFSKIDLRNAFLQIPLDEESKEVTTIHTCWGLFQYNFLPFGLTVAPGLFQQTMDAIIKGLAGVRSYQDDLLVFGKTIEEHDGRLLKLLQVLHKRNVRINPDKSLIGVQQLKYLGYVINGQGIHADKNRIRALMETPKPTTAQELQSLLGFAQYYAKFVPGFAQIARPLFNLLSEEEFRWTDNTQAALDQLFRALLDGEVLQSFQLGAKTELVVDASEYAIGAVLEQQGHPIICISRRLSKAERNYSQTQREALAVIWAVKRLHKYLFGNKFHLVTDHKALEFIMRPDSSLSKCTSAMLQRWAISLASYDYTIQYRPGKQIPHADFLSRHSKHEPPETDDSMTLFINPLPIGRNHLIQETRLIYGPVLAGLRNGWSNSARKRFPELFAVRSEMTLLADGVIVVHDRPLIPPSCRGLMLSHLHVGHLGRDKMKSLARLLCWWPSMDKDIAIFLKECRSCQEQKPTRSHHPKWKPWPIPFSAMQRVHADYCGPFLDGRYYALVIEDSFSKFPEVFVTPKATAEFTKRALRRYFSREGIPQALVTDNGTHFTGEEVQSWLRTIGCRSVFTAPRHPASNGIAERFVRTLKTAVSTAAPTTKDELEKSIDSFLLQYRNATHPSTGKSPAMLFKGRNLRTAADLDSTDVLFYRGNDSRPCQGLLLGRIGNRMYNVLDRADGSVHRRHIDQMELNSDPVLPTGPGSEGSDSSGLPTSQPITQPMPTAIQPTPVTLAAGEDTTTQQVVPDDGAVIPLRRSARIRNKHSSRYEDSV